MLVEDGKLQVRQQPEPVPSFTKGEYSDASCLANTGVTPRVREEAMLFAATFHRWLISLTVLVKFAWQVFRNAAFYRYPNNVEISERLGDLGFELIPRFPDPIAWLGDEPKRRMLIVLLIMIFAAFRGNKKGSVKPYAVNMGLRFTEMMALGHTLRFMTYIATTLPGAADHCFGDYDFFHEVWPSGKPTNAQEVWSRVPIGHPGTNCGDLIFSGHMLRTWAMWFVINRYSKETFQMEKGPQRLMMAIVTIAGIIQFPCVLAARNHYSVDCVVACYVAPLLWHW